MSFGLKKHRSFLPAEVKFDLWGYLRGLPNGILLISEAQIASTPHDSTTPLNKNKLKIKRGTRMQGHRYR